MEKIFVPYSEDFCKDYDTVECESPHRVIDIWLKIKDIADFTEPGLCPVADLSLCHTERIIRAVEKDEEVFRVARRAAGGAIATARACLGGRPSFALVRPPGHHAGRNLNGGFCFFNNMALAITKVLSEGLVKRALIVDIDLHYGNGTEDIVKDDPPHCFQEYLLPQEEPLPRIL